MADKLFVIELMGGAAGDLVYVQQVRATRVVEHDEYLHFIQEDGSIGALFLKAIVRRWYEQADIETAS